MTFLCICLGIVVIILLIAIAWRLASAHCSLPCPVWLAHLVEMDNPFLKSHHASVIVQRLDLRPGMRVLDLGCGPGRLTIPIARQLGAQGEVVAQDVQVGMLEKVKEKAQSAGLTNIRFVQGGAGEGKLGHSQYDRVLLVTVLGEIPDREGALKEIFGALKPGGILSVTEAISDPHYQRRIKVLQSANAVGFREKAVYGNWLSFTMNFEKPFAP